MIAAEAREAFPHYVVVGNRNQRSLRYSNLLASMIGASKLRRRKGWEVTQRQVNVRLDEDTIEILEAAGFLDGRNLTDEARAAIVSRAEEAGSDPLVQQARDLRRQRKAAAAGEPSVVSSLEEKRKRSRPRNG